MKNHLDLAHFYWKKTVSEHDTVIDATCGNGYDTLFLAELNVKIIAYDIQLEAIEATRTKVPHALFRHQSHAQFEESEAALIVYNLGYLPGGDKNLTTRCSTTLQSLQYAVQIATKALSITCYPGHDEGAKEEKMVIDFAATLNPKIWHVCYHQWLNRHKSPSLLWLSRLPL